MRVFMAGALALVTSLVVSPVALATCGGGGGGGGGGVRQAMPVGPAGIGTPQATATGTGNPDAYVVPWRFLKPGAAPLKRALTLYWFPVSQDEIQKSDLVSSRELSLDATQCIGMRGVLPDDTATIKQFDATDKRPLVLLVDSDGKVLGRVGNTKGELHVARVEKMVKDEIGALDDGIYDQFVAARKKNASGDKNGAIAIYKKIWAQRCLFPAAARMAKDELRALGIIVKDAELGSIDPDRRSATTRKMVRTMNAGLAAEMAGDYLRARDLYQSAARLDPADPTPLRYLGELYRHDIGNWTEAREAFNRILTMRADPLSRAVALHGMGKMTIHDGQYAKGLAMFQESIATYPLALTYRNLAVYWNSEKDHKKAWGYVQKALTLDPHDPYNIVFAATYMADSGRGKEALEIAKKNESFLAASYNLAAIYALLGNKGKAMELLHRHFYKYEKFDAVREKEMKEARVDYVFETLRNDPAFIKLTALAQ